MLTTTVGYPDPFESDRALILLFERNLFAKPVPTLAATNARFAQDHALAVQMAIQLESHNTILVSSRLSERKTFDS